MVTNIEKELPFAYADIALVEQVLENLLENALRYTPEEGAVSVVMNHVDSAYHSTDKRYRPGNSRKGPAAYF